MKNFWTIFPLCNGIGGCRDLKELPYIIHLVTSVACGLENEVAVLRSRLITDCGQIHHLDTTALDNQIMKKLVIFSPSLFRQLQTAHHWCKVLKGHHNLSEGKLQREERRV